MTPADRTRAWVEHFVVRLGLCPFAALPLHRGTVAFVSCDRSETEAVFYWTLEQIRSFVDQSPEQVTTTLLIFPEALSDFSEFLDLVEELEEVLSTSGADSLVQFAHFHPDYCFADLSPEDPANKTNRSPHPVLQLLRVDGVAEAVAAYPQVEAIPERNISLLRRLAAAGELP